MSSFLDILRCVLCCVEDDRDEGGNEVLYWDTLHSSNELFNIEETYGKFVAIFRDQFNGSNRTRNVSGHSYDPPESSFRLPNPSSIPNPSRLKPQTSSSNQIHSSAPESSCAETFSVHPKCLPSASKLSLQSASVRSLNPSPSAHTLPTCFSKPPPSFPTPVSSPSKQTPVLPKPPLSFPTPVSSSSKQTPVSPVVPKPTLSFPSSVSSSSKPTPISPILPHSSKPTLAPASANSIDQQKKANYILDQKDKSPIYAIPKDIKDLIKKEKVPEILKKPLTLSTYKDYFAALLYAEDFYIEKWSQFKLVNVTLNLQEATVFKWSHSRDMYVKEEKTFVAFEIDSCLEKRPFLLSRDFVFVRPSGRNTEPFQGILCRVERSTRVLVEFGGDFHAQHLSSRRYDVCFSFNRVCLKRAHQAIIAASDPLFGSFTFPDCKFRKKIRNSSPPYINYKLNRNQISAVCHILAHQGTLPYLVEGPLCVPKGGKRNTYLKCLSVTGEVVQQAVLEIYQTSKTDRVLICAPINNTCDDLMKSLKEIPESEIFRANAAFREIDGLSLDILTSSLYKDNCFTCPPLEELKKFRVILSTYVSSFRLHNAGITAGHFSHIFMVDASSATEPEVMVALANLGNENTAVIVTGAPNNHSGWVRSNLARENGLMISYFERLRQRNPYKSLDPSFITQLVNSDSNG